MTSTFGIHVTELITCVWFINWLVYIQKAKCCIDWSVEMALSALFECCPHLSVVQLLKTVLNAIRTLKIVISMWNLEYRCGPAVFLRMLSILELFYLKQFSFATFLDNRLLNELSKFKFYWIFNFWHKLLANCTISVAELLARRSLKSAIYYATGLSK